MITNVSLVTLYVSDQDTAKKFYTENLGFVEATDITLGDGFRWVTIVHPDHPELQVSLTIPGSSLNTEVGTAISRALADGTMHGFGMHTSNCRETYEELLAKGIDFIQPPSERPYGIEAVMRDNSGNWLVLVEPKEFTGEDFPH